MGNHSIITLYILEWPSSWSTLRIRPSWPQSRIRLSLLLVLFPKYISCLLWTTQYLCLLFVPMAHVSHSLTSSHINWQLNTCVQVNNVAALHHIYTDAHIYITSLLLFILFFTLLPLLWQAGCLRLFPSDTLYIIGICKLFLNDNERYTVRIDFHALYIVNS